MKKGRLVRELIIHIGLSTSHAGRFILLSKAVCSGARKSYLNARVLKGHIFCAGQIHSYIIRVVLPFSSNRLRA